MIDEQTLESLGFTEKGYGAIPNAKPTPFKDTSTFTSMGKKKDGTWVKMT
jgi:hypothetical protein